MIMDEKDLARMNMVLRHTLRNFASGIKTAMSILSSESEGHLSSSAMEYFPLIVNECDKLNDMTKRLNLLFEVASEGEYGSVGSALEGLLSDLHNNYPTAHIDINVDSKVLKDVILPDIQAVRTALREATVNALEEDINKRVVIACDPSSGGFLRLCVEDRGSGVDPVEHDKIFQPFYTTKSRHVGIGLAIARKLINGMKGKSEACKNGYGGLTVAFYVPV